MIELEVLDALDGLQWLGCGEEVSRKLGISQPTVSRHCARALSIFGLLLERQHGEWELIGDQTFLRLERQVHQSARALGFGAMRLEATYWSAPFLCSDLPSGWMMGRSNIVGIKRNLQLLQERIIDAWIAGLPDVPTPAHPELAVIHLSRMPVYFTCAPGHPLLSRQTITYADIAEFPSLALPAGSYPLVEQALKSLGLWNDGIRMTRYQRQKWEAKSEAELTISYGTPLSLAISGGRLCRLPLRLPFDSGDALVVHRDLQANARVEALIGHLRQGIEALRADHPEVEGVAN